jgi:hypothetical protein
MLIAGLLVVIVAVVILLVDHNSGGSKKTGKTTTSAQTTPTATATPQFQQLGGLNLTSPSGGKARGQMVLFASNTGTVAFTLQATNVPASKAGEAYAVWLVGGKQPHRLGFAPPVKADGKLGTSGPRQQDARSFAKWFSAASEVVVSRETSSNASAPGPAVLVGRIPHKSG